MTAETHPINQENVMAYLDGELLPDEAEQVAQHLEQCAACAELAAELRGVSSRLLAWNVEPEPKRLRDVVLEELNKRGASERRARSQQSPPRVFPWEHSFRRRWVWATSGVVAVVLGVAVVAPLFQPTLRFASFQKAQPSKATSAEFDRLQAYGQLQKAPDRKAGSLPEDETPSNGPMITRTATVNVSAKDFDAARISMDRIVRAHQGYLSSLNVSTERGAPRSLDAKIAVPAAQFDATLADIRMLGRVRQEQQSSEEVTSQIVDLDARIKNGRETEAQFAEILRSHAGKVADVLDVEKEIARVREEIEVMEASRKRLHDQVAFSSIDLNLAEEYQAKLGDASWSVSRRIRNGFVDGYRSAADGLLSVCVFLLQIGPSLLVWGLILLWPARRAWRRWNGVRAETVPGA
jgi:Domain of unknown function (DUF4349)/Putative zinc-finger